MYPLTINNGVSAEQLSLDGIGNNKVVAEKRLKEVKKILGNDFTKLKRTIIITYDYFDDKAVNGLEILVDNNFNVVDEIVIPEYNSPSPDDDTTRYDNQKNSVEDHKSDSIVKWNDNKTKRSTRNKENNNGTSN